MFIDETNEPNHNIEIIDIRDTPGYEDVSIPGYDQYIEFMEDESDDYPDIYIPIREYRTDISNIADYATRFEGAWYRFIYKGNYDGILETKDDPNSGYALIDYGTEIYVREIQGSMASVYYDEDLGWIDLDMLVPVQTPIVFIDGDNEYYHSEDCVHLNNAYTPLYFMDAYDKGYFPCKFCN